MEGRWRVCIGWLATAAAAGAVVVGASGCGDDKSVVSEAAAVHTENVERTFAPLVELQADEPWRPMSARWFIERAIFRFAEDGVCNDRKIAVGHTLSEQQNPTIDWIYPKALGGWSWPAYFRNPLDQRCKIDFDSLFYTDQLTRPHDPGLRVEGLRPGEGFYLDLVDGARVGPAIADNRNEISIPVYGERTDEGDGGIRLTYWMLFGMNGTPDEPDAHEGDWERVDVLLRDLGEHRYLPIAVQVKQKDSASEVSGAGVGLVRDIAWAAARKVDGTHPVVRLEPLSHKAEVARAGDSCPGCIRWVAWRSLTDAAKQKWYGFGGAWGQPGDTSATTGPLGPHRFFPSASERKQELSE